MKTYQGHTNEKYSLSGAVGVYANVDESERRAFVVSGSEDGRIFTWDIQSKEILQTMEGHEGVVLGVDTWEEGNLMVSCGMDRTIRIWERRTEEEEADGGGKEEVEGREKERAKISEEDVEMKDEEGGKPGVDARPDGDGEAVVNGHVDDDGELPNQDPEVTTEDATKDEDAVVDGVAA